MVGLLGFPWVSHICFGFSWTFDGFSGIHRAYPEVQVLHSMAPPVGAPKQINLMCTWYTSIIVSN